jgi:branched-chain amino acid transport system ATP-binding protein
MTRPAVDQAYEQPLLSVRDVVAGYRGDRVLNGISIDIRNRQVVALLGANGVGKTTLLRAIAGMIPCRRGTIRLEDVRISGMAHYKVSRMGVSHVPEGRGIFPGLTVRENLEIARFARVKGKTTNEIGLQLFPVLRGRLSQRGGTLSGGEQQMLALARSLAADPKLLLLDEPSLGLAPQIVARLYEALREIKQAGMAMLIAEQAAAEALELADYVYVIGVGGKILASGEPSAVLAQTDLFQAYMG